MTKTEAKRQLMIGYIIFVIGLFIGYSIQKSDVLSPLLIGYVCWSTFWGYKLLYRKIKNYSITSPVHLSARSSFDYFKKVLSYKWFSELIIFIICYIVGNMGGSLFMQVKLSKIAYF